MLLLACVNSPIFTLSSVFIIPVSSELGISRAVFSMHMMISNFGSMLGSLLAGSILRRVPARKLVLVALVFSAACFIGYARALSVWVFYICSFVLGFCYIAVSNVTVSVFVTNWFPESLRGKAMGIAACGSGIGSFVLLPIVGHVVSSFGWRIAYAGFAGMILFLAFPIVLLFFSPSPEERHLVKMPEDGACRVYSGEGMTREEAIRTPSFWLLILFSALAATASLFNTTGYSYFCDIGISPAQASWLMSVASGVLIGAKILLGAVCDRYGAKKGSVAAGICFFLAYTFALSAAGMHVLAVPTVLFFGMGNAVTTVALPLLVTECFGEKEYSSLIGIFFIGNYAGSGFGPVLASAIFDHSGSYTGALKLSMVLTMVMVGIVLLLENYAKQGTRRRVIDSIPTAVNE